MPSLVFNSCIAGAFRGRINVDADDFGVMLLDESYSPSKSGHTTRADVQEFEITARGYEEGGRSAAVSMSVVVLDGEDDVFAFDIHLGVAQWRGTITARYACYYRKAYGDAVEDDLIAVIDFGGVVISTNGPFEVEASTLRIEN